MGAGLLNLLASDHARQAASRILARAAAVADDSVLWCIRALRMRRPAMATPIHLSRMSARTFFSFAISENASLRRPRLGRLTRSAVIDAPSLRPAISGRQCR